jgi:hypothetical protein
MKKIYINHQLPKLSATFLIKGFVLKTSKNRGGLARKVKNTKEIAF